jgi:AcrR family transcriptional regulator
MNLAPEITDPTEGRRARRRRELHQSILDTAAELFARDGYDATTVETIAAAADVAPATFFNHFRSKEDVLREIGQDVFARFRRLVDEQLAREVSSVERLHGFAARSAALVRRAPEMTRRVLTAVLRTARPGEAGAELVSMQAGFARLLESGREAHDIPDDLDVDLAAEILVSVVIGAMTHWINDPAYPLEQRMRSTLALLGDRLIGPSPKRSTPRKSTRKIKTTTKRSLRHED